MPRVAILLLMLAYALVPPGFCLCRVSELVLPATEVPCPDHHDDDDCECPRIQHDGVGPTSLPMIAGVLPPVPFVAVADVARSTSFADDLSLTGRDLDQPIYQTLRAFLL